MIPPTERDKCLDFYKAPGIIFIKFGVNYRETQIRKAKDYVLLFHTKN